MLRRCLPQMSGALVSQEKRSLFPMVPPFPCSSASPPASVRQSPPRLPRSSPRSAAMVVRQWLAKGVGYSPPRSRHGVGRDSSRGNRCAAGTRRRRDCNRLQSPAAVRTGGAALRKRGSCSLRRQAHNPPRPSSWCSSLRSLPPQRSCRRTRTRRGLTSRRSWCVRRCRPRRHPSALFA